MIRPLAACLARPASRSPPAAAPGRAPRSPPGGTALSLLGEPKYPAGFPHFDYVNPDAPKGGLVRFGAQGTFDSFNLFVAGREGRARERASALIYDTLMTAVPRRGRDRLRPPRRSRSPIRTISRSVTFRLRPEARWHDGRPVTPDDVIFSFEALQGEQPDSTRSTTATSPRRRRPASARSPSRFDETGNRELPQIVGQLPVLPKHWWEGDGAGRPPARRRRRPRSSRRSAPAPTGSRASRRAARRRLRARAGLLGRRAST